MQPTRRIARPSTALVALPLAVLLTVAGCTSSKPHPTPSTSRPATASATTAASSPAASPTPSAADIAFSDCSKQFQTAIGNAQAKTKTFSCGKLSVPLDYSQPTGQGIQLFVVKVHSKTQRPGDRLGSLLVNPGGPGGSGVNLAAGLVGALSDSLFAHFDLVGFDPRGVGLSGPLQCISDKQKDALAQADPDPRTVAGRAAAKAVSDTVVKACVAAYGRALGHYNTEETAHDVELIRQVVGGPELNYPGSS
ncbi:MAG: alpha/beta hydrolase, partial [Jatrophihabitans sp.]